MECSWTAQALRQADETPPGPLAFLIFCILKTWHTSSSQISSAGWEAVGGQKGQGVFMVVWRDGQSRCGVWDLAAIKLIQIICQLWILHSAGGWSLVARDGFQALPHSLAVFFFFSFSEHLLLVTLMSLFRFFFSFLFFVLFVQGFVPNLVGTLFGLVKLFEFWSETWLVFDMLNKSWWKHTCPHRSWSL